MKAYYSLLDQPWLTAVTLTGESAACGIRQVLQQAHTLRALTVASPMVEYGLHRLLIVLLMDALRPQDQFDLVRFIGCRIGLTLHSWKDYYAQCGQEGCSFDLFDSERPFLQAPYRPAW